jgi:hypothetical protein
MVEANSAMKTMLKRGLSYDEAAKRLPGHLTPPPEWITVPGLTWDEVDALRTMIDHAPLPVGADPLMDGMAEVGLVEDADGGWRATDRGRRVVVSVGRFERAGLTDRGKDVEDGRGRKGASTGDG